jgi:hypothetical protein
MGAYENPTVATTVNPLQAFSESMYKVNEALQLAKKKKEENKFLLETGAVEKTNTFQSNVLSLQKKGSPISNMNEVASTMVDKYYENEKNYASKSIDANEYRRIRQNLWSNLGNFQTFQNNAAKTITSYAEDSEKDLVSGSANGLDKKKRLEAFKNQKAEIVAGDDGKATLRIYVPDIKDGKQVTTTFEKPLEDYVNNPSLLSYDKKADLSDMTKTMSELAKAQLHTSDSYETIKHNGVERFFYDRDAAKNVLKTDNDLTNFVSGHLESIVEDYMDEKEVYIPDTPETHDAYVAQLEKAKDWYADYIYNNKLGHQVGQKALPQTKASKLPKTKAPKSDIYVQPTLAGEIEKWDGTSASLTNIDPQLRLVGTTIFKGGQPFLKLKNGEDLNEGIKRLNIKLGYIKEAPKKL